ncbi:hypothetical protein GGR57DRAFT_453141 [Xylariaceae sp. FL1272]|nr:hypothetical protein GGR57DRAFT_453141 [Xylariaceae sp. FL1272]
MATTLGVWSGSWGYIASLLVLALLASLAVILRFWSRYTSMVRIRSDDWLALTALLLHHGLTAAIILAFLKFDLGYDIATKNAIDPGSEHRLQKLTLAGTLLYGFSITTLRLSVIIFYFRIFPTRTLRRTGFALIIICMAWFITIEGVNLANCTPISYNWDKTIKAGHCISSAAAIIVITATNVLIDAVTVGLPVHEVLKLRLSKQKKHIILCIFLVAGLATVASLGRLVAVLLYLPHNTQTTGSTSAALAAITGYEVYIATIGACLPTLTPVLKKLQRRPTGSDSPIPHRSVFTTRQPIKSSHNYTHTSDSSGRKYLKGDEDEERPLKTLDDVQKLVPAKSRGEFWIDISGRGRPASSAGIPLAGIRVQRDLHWKEIESSSIEK